MRAARSVRRYEHRNASLQKPSCDHCIEVIRQSHDGRVDTFAQCCEISLGGAGLEIALQEFSPMQLPIDHHHRRKALEAPKCGSVKPLRYRAAADNGESDWDYFTQPTLLWGSTMRPWLAMATSLALVLTPPPQRVASISIVSPCVGSRRRMAARG